MSKPQLGLIVLGSAAQLTGLIAQLSGEEGLAVIDAAVGAAGAKAADPLDDDAFDVGEVEETIDRTTAELKTILTQVRDKDGDDALKEILTAAGAKTLKELVAAGQDAINEAYAIAEELLKDGGEADEEDPFGELDDDLDDVAGEVPDVATVKAACQAMAKKEGKDVGKAALEAGGLNTVRGLANASDEALGKIWAKVSKYA